MDLCEHDAPDGLVALGLGGPETPRHQFVDYFARARALGLASVPHAGEAAGPESVRCAIEHLQATRFGHGIRALDDPDLVASLRDRGTHLEVCLTSNVRTGLVRDLAHHPLPAMIEAGPDVSINSDDPPMFGTTLTHEFCAAASLVGAEKIPDLLRNAIGASHMPSALRATLRAELDVAAPPAYGSRWAARRVLVLTTTPPGSGLSRLRPVPQRTCRRR